MSKNPRQIMKSLFQVTKNFDSHLVNNNRGFSFVELLISVAIMVLVFGGLFAGIQAMIQVIGNSKASTGALALATERMEYIRSLSYDSVGTIAGIPNGAIPQNATRTLNGVTYNERVLIEYVDAPEDGIGGADANGILADYKRVKIEYSWDDRGTTKYRSLVSNIVPRGVETTSGRRYHYGQCI